MASTREPTVSLGRKPGPCEFGSGKRKVRKSLCQEFDVKDTYSDLACCKVVLMVDDNDYFIITEMARLR
jgi:hypothetical protein